MSDIPVKPSTGDIYRLLRERICLLDIPPGARLTEESLAAEFGVSRTPIRQVLDRLEFERLVDQQPGAGARVAVLDSKALRDVWAVRLKMAELIDEFVQVPPAPGVLDELSAIADELQLIRTSRDVRALGRLYTRFHETMLGLVANQTLRWIHDVLYHQTARVWLQFLPEMDLDTELDIMDAEVQQTVEALSQPTGTKLADLRARHMRMLLDRYNDHLRGPS